MNEGGRSRQSEREGESEREEEREREGEREIEIETGSERNNHHRSIKCLNGPTGKWTKHLRNPLSIQ